MANRSLGHRAPLLWLLLPFMGGLAAGKWLARPLPAGGLLAAALIAALLAAGAAWSSRAGARRLWPVALGAAMLLGGAAYFQLRLHRLAAWDGLPPREARLGLRVTRVFAPPADGRKISGLAVITGAGPHLRDLAGQRVYFSLALPRGKPRPLRSAEIDAVGVLELLPRTPPDGGFESYLAAAGMNYKLTRGRLLGEISPPTRYQRFCAAAADKFSRTLGAGLEKHPELAVIYRGMLLGQKSDLSDEQHALFLHSGTMHLFAISGLHIGAIAVALHSLLALLRMPRRAAFVLGAAALWLYVDITGASPSATRAFVMVIFIEAAFLFRQPANALASLTLSALVMLLFDPFQLFSASFQMSYGIVATLLLLGLPLAERWQARWPLFASLPEVTWRWHHRWRDAAWRQALAATGIGWAATLVSGVTGVTFFQLFTPGALAANLALIPLALLVILAGFLSLLTGLAGFAAGSGLLNHAGALVLWGMDRLIRAGLKAPGMFWPAEFRAAWIGPAALAALLAVCLAGYAGQWRTRRGGFWPPVAVVAAALIFGTAFG